MFVRLEAWDVAVTTDVAGKVKIAVPDWTYHDRVEGNAKAKAEREAALPGLMADLEAGIAAEKAEAEKSQRGAKYWLRWVAVFPAGLGAYVAATFPVHWGTLLIQNDDSQDGNLLRLLNARDLETYAVALICTAIFVYVGSRVAPSRKVETAMWLAIGFSVLAAFFIGSLVLAGTNPEKNLVVLGLRFAGAAAGYVSAKEKATT